MLKRHSQLVFSIISRTNFINKNKNKNKNKNIYFPLPMIQQYNTHFTSSTDPKYFSYLNGNQSKLFLNYIKKTGENFPLNYTEGIT